MALTEWAHSMAEPEICPANHPLVKSYLEGAKRKLARPVRSKRSLYPWTRCRQLSNFMFQVILLPPLFVFCSYCYLVSMGFFRIDEINSFCLKDVTINALNH